MKKFGERTKVYNLEDVTIMLPLVQRICADVESNMGKVKELTENEESLDQNDVEFYLRQRADRQEDLKHEIVKLKGRICHARYGFVDFPVWHPHLAEVVHVCVSSLSEPGKLRAHLTTQKAKDRKFFWSM